LSAIFAGAYLGLFIPVAGQQPSPRLDGFQVTDHLKIRPSSSHERVAAGARISLGVEIEPRPRMHVYAPGAENYQIISMTISGPSFVRVLPLEYPASEIYFFEPFKERVPVYQKPFKLVREVVFDSNPEAEKAFRQNRKITLKGSLDYQACDDKVCFMPVSVPLSWTVQLQRYKPAK
jgi:hypothetical protein